MPRRGEYQKTKAKKQAALRGGTLGLMENGVLTDEGWRSVDRYVKVFRESRMTTASAETLTVQIIRGLEQGKPPAETITGPGAREEVTRTEAPSAPVEARRPRPAPEPEPEPAAPAVGEDGFRERPHVFVLEGPAGKTRVMTAGLTEAQWVEVMRRVTRLGGHPEWERLQALGKQFVTTLGQPSMAYLTEAEGVRLLELLDAAGGVTVPGPAGKVDPARQAALDRWAELLRRLPEHRLLLEQHLADAHQGRAAAELTPHELTEAVKTYEVHAADPAVLGIMLQSDSPPQP